MTSTFASHSGSSIEAVSSSSNQLVFTATTSSRLDEGKDTANSQRSVHNNVPSVCDNVDIVQQLPLAGLPIYSTPSPASLTGMLRTNTQPFVSPTSIASPPAAISSSEKSNTSPDDSTCNQNQSCLVCGDRASVGIFLRNTTIIDINRWINTI